VTARKEQSQGRDVIRRAEFSRTTNETDVSVSLALDGAGLGNRSTGIGFLDHLLEALARHGRLDLDVRARGDLQTGAHHTVEDTGIAIGRALDEALGDRAGIARFGDAIVVMDEARAAAVVDVSGRPYHVFEGELPPLSLGGLEPGLCEEFFRAVAHTAKLTLHVRIQRGRNAHHMVEAAFKAFARALRQAVALDPLEEGVPSTKGVL
jgi:imidazoleglycerol-phosphate dehydratase